jgi:endo-1,4-beta-xylanase
VRRSRVVGTLAIVLSLVVTCAGASDRRVTDDSSADWPPLRALARAHGLRIGTAVSFPELRDDDDYRRVLRREFSMVTPENAMKWDTIHPRPRTYDFAHADRIVAMARRNRMQVRGHTLVWHAQNPPWLEKALTSRRRAIKILRAHIRRVARHYRRDVTQWDVVNEPLQAAGGALRDSPWLRAIGPDYIELALRFAHRAAPRAKLYLNDFGLDETGDKLDGMAALVANLKARGVPLHGVGFQSHGYCLESCSATFVGLENALRRVADLGVAVALTELDVLIPSPSTAAGRDDQATSFRRAIDACLAVARCRTIVTWGFTDRYSLADVGLAEAHTFDADYRPKPAYWALYDRLR